ncbi:FecR family protein [Pedobacter lusitanus]|nr:FecR domain-containing protein [Pedobacter lusitanus]
MTNEKFRELARRCHEGTASEAEQKAFDEIYTTLLNRHSSWDTELMGAEEEVKAEISGKLNRRIRQDKKKKNHSLFYRYIAAAIVIVALGTGIYFYQQLKAPADQQRFFANDIKPGGNKAVLTLANGKKISLTDAENTELANESGIRMTKTGDGQLICEVSGKRSAADPHTRNCIETPKGGQYQIQLPDGTKVWLNASSSLKYPDNFGMAKERRVELTGEAYFEVAHNQAVPFRVMLRNQLVEVLGTHFNINGYEDEAAIRTTLLEGSVKLSRTDSQISAILKPGQQARLQQGGFRLKEVDALEAVAWKNDEFLFNDEDFLTAMRKIARWYDVEVVYDSSAPIDFQLGGSVKRSKNISAVLTLIELTGKVHFKIEGRRVTVTK